MYHACEYTFSAFTPTYNRAGLLPRVFASLQAQTFCDFEWIIVDDGSTDDTRSLVEEFTQQADFPITYVWKENEGKHIAINTGVGLARGYFFSIMDSDDWYEPHAFERFLFHWQNIPRKEREDFLGVCGLFAYETGEIVGTKFPHDVFDANDFILKYQHKVTGDKLSVIRTEIMRNFPFPDDLGKFIPESIVWYRMAKKYHTRFVNEVVAIKEYQSEGLTDKGALLHSANPAAARLTRYELLHAGIPLPFGVRFKAYVNYSRYSLLAKVALRRQFAEMPSKLFWLLTFPLGCSLAVRDWLQLRRAE